jgi:6,7-dimethyl-8-ribityllumazine synthase
MRIEPGPLPTGTRIAVVAARFNEEVTDKLLAGALARLAEKGYGGESVHVARTAGAFEVPGVAERLARTRRYAAVICLGAVIRGETPHFDYVCEAATYGIMKVMIETGVPCAFGVLTCDTDEQALERAGGRMGHKGVECVDAALEMAGLYSGIERQWEYSTPVRGDRGPSGGARTGGAEL